MNDRVRAGSRCTDACRASRVAPRVRGRLTATIATLVLGITLNPSVLSAQRRASELASVSQVVNGTRVTIEYSRPLARGRVPFGERGNSIVHWGELWTPGANWATTFETDRDIDLNGNRIPKGKYSVWMIPQPNEWTVLLSTVARRYHVNRPNLTDRKDELVRFTVKPAVATHLETLTFVFSELSKDAMTLDFHWGTALVPLEIKVLSPQRTAVAAADRAQFVGEYTAALGRDSTRTYRIRVYEEGEFLRAHSEPIFFPSYDADFDLNPRGEALMPMMYIKGEMYDEEELRFVFDRGPRHATGFVAYGPAGRVFMKGTRVN
jgi:hypothetical protein